MIERHVTLIELHGYQRKNYLNTCINEWSSAKCTCAIAIQPESHLLLLLMVYTFHNSLVTVSVCELTWLVYVLRSLLL